MRKLLTLILFLCTVTLFAEMRGGSQYDPGAVRSNLTNIASGSALGVANGGTGKTTAAEALAALGGASLNGSSTVPFNASIYNNADGDIADLVAMANGFNPRRWGFKIDKANSDPEASVSYTYDAVGMTPLTMAWDGGPGKGTVNRGSWISFIDAICRPVMLNPDGTVAYELDHNDQTKKLDGTPSGISSTTHDMNAMVEFKRLWYSVTEDASYIYVTFSNVKYDETYVADAFKTEAGVYRDRMYYSMFEGSNVNNKLRSLAAGVVMVGAAGQTEIDYADNNGAGWYITYYSQHNLIALLHVLIGKSLDCQAVFGRGNEGGGAYIDPGALKAEGAFSGYNSSVGAVKTFYIEHFWANYWKRCAGLLYRNDAGTGKIYVRTSPGYNETGDGYTNTGVTPSGTTGDYLKSVVASANTVIPAVATGASASTYFADGFWWALPTNPGECHYALVAGSRLIAAPLCGPFCVAVDVPPSFANSYLGARLSFLKP